ncbi:S ribonuclease [Pyrus ussuriensis x Pyrus communis]|uniref:S ribonuclease n=1 Tax=Pyrus ussuriensis x Pyrus communis TaxID=2448454 RepID=A0A5N5EWS4_9ROSA|nr:S ribonuclease [Pyrus ussuriensis x Pyrus communis]
MRRVLELVRRLRNVAFASQIQPRLPSRLHLTPVSHFTSPSLIRPRLETKQYMLRLLEERRRLLSTTTTQRGSSRAGPEISGPCVKRKTAAEDLCPPSFLPTAAKGSSPSTTVAIKLRGIPMPTSLCPARALQRFIANPIAPLVKADEECFVPINMVSDFSTDEDICSTVTDTQTDFPPLGCPKMFLTSLSSEMQRKGNRHLPHLNKWRRRTHRAQLWFRSSPINNTRMVSNNGNKQHVSAAKYRTALMRKVHLKWCLYSTEKKKTIDFEIFSSDCKSDEYPLPLYRQGGFSSKVGYFKAAHVKINSNDLFRDFLEAYKHAIPLGVHVKQVKDDNAMNHAFWYFFNIGHKEGVEQLRSCHKLFDASCKCDHEWVRNTLEVSEEWESDYSPELRVPTTFISVWLNPKDFANMKKVHNALGILAEYREWRWLLNHFRQEKEFTTNESGKNRSFSPACKPSAEKKPMTYPAIRGSSSAAEKLAINLTSPKGEKKTVEPELVKPAASKVTTSITERLTQRKGSVVLPVSRFVSKRLSGAKSGLTSERLAAIKSENVDSAVKVASKPVFLSAVIESSTKKGKSARTDSCEIFTEFGADEFPKVCALLKADLLEDVDACAKFVNSVRKVVIRSDSMRVDQDVVKCAKDAELKIAHQEVVDLKIRLNTTQVMLEAVENEVSCVSPMVDDLKLVNSEVQSACFAKDEELIFMHTEVSRLKEVASKLKSKEVDLQGTLSVSENLRKELDELQGAHTGLIEENVQLKNEKVGHKVALASFQAGGAEDELMKALVARTGAAAEGVAVEEPMVAQATNE